MKRHYKRSAEFLVTANEVVSDIYQYNKWIVVMGVLFSVCFSIFSITTVHTSKWLLDSLNNAYFMTSIQILLLITLLNLIKQVMNDYHDLKNEEYAFQISVVNQERLIQSLDGIDLMEKEHPAFQSKLSIASRGLTMYFGYFRRFIQVGESLLTAVIALVFLFQNSLYLGLSVMAISLIKTFIVTKIMNKKVFLNRDLQEHQREPQYFYNLLIDVPAQKELKAYGITDFLLKKWNAGNSKVHHFRKSLHLMQVKNNTSQHVFTQLSLAAVVTLIIVLVSEKKLTIGDYFALTLALNLAENKIASFVRNIVKSIEETYYIQDFKRFIGRDQTALQDSEPTSPFQFNHDIEIKNLSFKYPNSIRNVLDNINLKIIKGQKVVILGENGSGKSTLLKLLAGLYQAPDNTIYYDGESLHRIDKGSVFNNMSVVFQDFTKYMLTVKENITLGSKEEFPNHVSLDKALQRAGFKDLNKLPSGLETRLGYLTKESVNLSGGQWQKLVLARGLYNESDFLLLDEPTAAIDSESETGYLEDLFSDKSKTVIVITHRISIASLADYIVLMRDGRIEEEGTHEQLLRNENGVYKRMWEQQLNTLQSSERTVMYG